MAPGEAQTTPNYGLFALLSPMSTGLMSLDIFFNFLLFVLEHGLGGGQPRDGHAVGRAAHVVKAETVAEFNRGGISAVLTADPELDVLAGSPALLNGELHESSNPLLIQGDERIILKKIPRGGR